MSANADCPVCGNSCENPPIYRYTVEQAAAHFCLPTRDVDRNRRLRDCIAALWQDNQCEIHRCDQCGFAFGYPFVSGDETFYRLLHEQRGYPTWRWDYDVAIEQAIKKFPGGRVLDIGAGEGRFLSALDGSWERYAIEGSDLTRHDLKSKGIKVFGDLEDAMKSHGEEFQVITLFQVLEHISEFEPVLNLCRKLLAPDGRLIITVPDGEAMIRQEQITGCADMPPNHISKWTPDSLSHVLRGVGFECSKPLSEPSSWRNLKANLHMRVSAEASQQNSFASYAYSLNSRSIRKAVLLLLAGPALVRMVPHWRHLRSGGAFAIVSVLG